jgi:Cytochrome c553
MHRKLFALLLAASPVFAQPADAQKLFATHCSGCHGADAEGSDMGPTLSGTRRLRSRSLEQLRATIERGIVSAGMPAFHLPAPELDALAKFIRSLNTTAAESGAPGDPVAGAKFFFGKGQCAECHMVRGRGKAIGPDLSNVSREMTLGELRQVLRDPKSRITPGYEMVTVVLHGGATLRGFARGRTNFDLQLQDLDGRFHLLQASRIASVREEKQSIMQPVKASPTELRDLTAYLSNIHKMEQPPAPIADAPGSISPASKIRSPVTGSPTTAP